MATRRSDDGRVWAGSRGGVKDRLGGDMQWRKLGGRCERCLGDHNRFSCSFNPKELRCLYPPCTAPIGHITAACQELTKKCRVAVCKGAWGHRSTCHKATETRAAYGYTVEGANNLRKDFERFRHLLTDEERADMAGE